MTPPSIPVNELKRYKVILAGSFGVGKSQLVRAMLGYPRSPKYIATLGCDVHPVVYNNDIFDIWDCAGQDKFIGLSDGYFIGAHCIVQVTRNNRFKPDLFAPSNQPHMTIDLTNIPEPLDQIDDIMTRIRDKCIELE